MLRPALGLARQRQSRGLSTIGSRLGRVAIVVLTFAGVSAAAVVAYYIIEVAEARDQTPALVSEAFARHGREIDVSDLSSEQEKTLLAVQDPGFREHRGVDLSTPGAGMTTLTQGLVKQLYFPEGFRQGVAKIRQTLIARFALDALVSKDDQLTLFLNVAYLGHQEGAVHGLPAAARAYYGKSFQELQPEEYLSLIAMLINPNGLKPGTQRNHDRVRRIQQYLNGDYRPLGVADLEYDGVARRWRLHERLVLGMLALITGA